MSIKETLTYGFGKRDAKGKKIYSILQLALFIFLSATIVFVVTATLSYIKTRQTAMKGANSIMELNMDLATEIIHNHVQQAEISGYSLTSLYFNKERFVGEDGEVTERFIFDERKGRQSIEEIYKVLDQFMKTNESVAGACIGFEPGIYPEYGAKSVAPFVRRSLENDTVYEWLDLPTMGSDYTNKDWYKVTKESGKARWSPPYKDVKGAVITTFCIPIYMRNGNYLGTVAMDMNLEVFSEQLKQEIHPYEGSQVMLIGSDNMFLIHPIQSLVMESRIESIEKFKEEAEDQDMTLFCHTLDDNDMTVIISCPNKAIYRQTDELLNMLLRFSALGLILIEIICFITFVQVRRVAEDKASIEGELTVASNIQMSMLPKMFPAFPDRSDLDLYAMLKPAKSVGGDLYNYVIRKNDAGQDTLVFCLGDVSGKGVPAALLMAVVCSLFRNTVMKTINPKEIATDLNNCIAERNEYDMFCTMFFGSLNLETGVLTYCNAGHNEPVMIGNGKAKVMNVIPNMPLGVVEDFEYVGEETQMEKDNTLFVYTDGVTEAENISHNEYSDEKLINVLNGTHFKTSRQVIEAVAKSVREFAGKAEQSDDITMLAVKMTKQ